MKIGGIFRIPRKSGAEATKIALILIVSIIIFGFASNKNDAGTNFITIRLPYGVCIDIPRNWQVATNDQRITLDTAVESQLDLSNLPKSGSDLAFVAGYFDELGDKAKVSVRYYKNVKVSQSTIKQANPEDISKYDNELKQVTLRAAKASGDTILSWGGTRKQNFSDKVAFVSEYRRPPITGERGSFHVRLVRILDGPKSFTLTVSYNEVHAPILKPICDRIIGSLKIRN